LGDPQARSGGGDAPRHSDTSAAAERRLIALLREATPAQRYRLAAQLSSATRSMARRAIARAHPELDERECDLLFLRVHYGAALADRVRAWLAAAR
jgi:hypothetical protein